MDDKESSSVYSVGTENEKKNDQKSNHKPTSAAARASSDSSPKISHGILSRLPQDTAFQQQRLSSWQPILSPKWVISIFTLIAVVFIPIGIGLIIASNTIIQSSVRYDDLSSACLSPTLYPSLPSPTLKNCIQQVNLTVPNDMKSPVYVYYQLVNFYQNHRIYSASRSDYQLEGDDNPDLTTCIPTPASRYDSNGKILYPCGLIGNSVFNDTIAATLCPYSSPSSCTLLSNLTNNPSNNPYWQKDGIAWSADRNTRYKLNTNTINDINNNGNSSSFSRITPFGGYPMLLPTDEDMMVWMRVAGLPTFKKLYRVIHMDLYQGDTLSFTVNNAYDVSGFNGEKWIFISTTSALGGKNTFLGWAYITVGIAAGVFAAIFAIQNSISPREKGDLSRMMWPDEKNQ